MQITVTIPDELAAQAQTRGIVLDRYLPELLARKLGIEGHAALPMTSDAGNELAAE